MVSGKLRPGQIVKSVKGRDRGRYYLILDVICKSMVLVVNGENRKIDCPKKKNIKHLKIYPVVVEEIEKVLLAGQKVTNLEVMQAIIEIRKTPREEFL